MLGLMGTMGVIAAGFAWSDMRPTPAPAAPAPDESPLVWTEAGLIDFFQLNDHMTAEHLAKFRAIIAAVEPAPAAVQPAPVAKPHIKLSVESVRLASKPVQPAPEPVQPAPAVEPIQPAPEPIQPARQRKAGRSFRLSGENTAGLISIVIILVIALSNTIAGLCLRATISLPVYWLGWIDQETLTAFALNYALKLI
jgi:hypothetical protein